jgi:multiple sugar transport system permease protein
MSLVGKVGRKNWRSRLAMAGVYSLLILGALTTLYPFLLTVSTGFKGPTDQNDNKLIPEFWSNVDDNDDTGKLSTGSLTAKYLTDKYGGNPTQIDSTRIGSGASSSEVKEYETFLTALPLDHWEAGFRPAPNQQTSRLTSMYQAWLRTKYRTIDDLNKKYVEENVAFQTVMPPSEVLDQKRWSPRAGNKYPEWLEFKEALPAEFRIPVRKTKMFQDFLRSKYQNQFALVPLEVQRTSEKFEGVVLPVSGNLLEEFEQLRLPMRFSTSSVESLWAQQSNNPMPIVAFEKDWIGSHQSTIRQEMATRNYRYVLDYVALNGRALTNTMIFCGLAILTQLIVNPLAAFALSRYPIRASGKILLFLLATMAFPAEVAMIPSFLLLKNFGLLNTFAALVLPSAASGYMIFLLKGFFDSLPAELYEAGQLDGARDFTMLWKIALPLARPVLGYLSLTAFMGAYGAFMYAFVVAQDQRMWTLMVFIYQLQTIAPRSTIMAALTLAAIPTIVVFLLAQRVIMKGIVLPGER